MAIVVPVMPAIASRFGTDFTELQFVISGYVFGLAIAQPVCGLLSDRFGRRRVMLAGFSLFTVASMLCALAETLPLLVIGRFLQAMGVSVGTVATRAILRDTRRGDDFSVAMSYISVAMGLAPVLSPVAGGYLDAYLGFTAIFWLTALLGVVVLIGMFLRLPETLSPEHVSPSAQRLLENYSVLLRSRPFIGYTLIYGFVQGAFFAFLAIGAPLFRDAFFMDAKTFGLIWGSMALTYVFGALLNARVTPRVGAVSMMRGALWLTLLAGALLFVSGIADDLTPLRVLVPLGFLMMLAGITTPGAMAGAVQHHPEMAGTASGLSSALGLVLNGIFTVTAGAIYDGDFVRVAALILGACCAAAASMRLASPARPRRAGR